ncbi:arylsulfate sulfotransferase [Pedobacter sp. UYP24]
MKKYQLAFCLLFMILSCRKDKTIETPKEPEPTTVDFVIPVEAIKLNPSGNAPLAALVEFTTEITGHTDIIIKGKNGDGSDVMQSFKDNTTTHAIPIVGLYPNYKNTVEIIVTDSKQNKAKSSINITTGALPEKMPNYIHIELASLAKMESGMNLVSSFSSFPAAPQIPYILDSYGEIRWYLDFRNNPDLKNLFYDCGISRLANGNYCFVDQSSGKIYEVDILGKIVHTWLLGGYVFHHDIFEKPNGNFLVSVSKPGSTHTNGGSTKEDFIIEISRSGGSIVNVWDLRESLNEYRTVLTNDSNDWIHVNGIVFDPSDNTIIISGRTQGVVKLTADNRVKWILGPHRSWGVNRKGEDLNQFLLKPIDAAGNLITDGDVLEGTKNHTDFEWNWYQHSPQLMPTGNLLLFDNGDIRNFNSSAPTHYSRAVEYKINQNNMTVQQVWTYGKERGETTFSRIISSVKYLPGKDHILFSPGYGVPNGTGFGGKIVEVDYKTKDLVFQASISSANGWGFHRAIRMELYPNGNPYTGTF